MAFGLTLVFAGLVTAVSVSILGGILAVVGAIGWFREVLPVESEESTPLVPEEITIHTMRATVERIAVTLPRASLPVQIYPISAGVKGGLAGGIAMAFVAGLYGLVSGNGIWYAMNLLVAGLLPEIGTQSTSQIGAFNLQGLVLAVPLHLVISLLVGLLYGAMLPIAPRRPILLGGVAGPLLWSLLIYGGLAVINPFMNERIDWVWFVLSQVGFGLVAGLIVVRQQRITTQQPVPLSVRLGIEVSGNFEDRDEERKP
jgi:hypothetical protein